MLNTRRATPAAGKTSPRDVLVAFIALLEREQQALVCPDADVIEAIAAEKQALARTLHALSPAAPARQHQSEIAALARRAKQLNAGNASLLALHRTSCESRLRVLRGSQQGNTLYSANGYFGR